MERAARLLSLSLLWTGGGVVAIAICRPVSTRCVNREKRGGHDRGRTDADVVGVVVEYERLARCDYIPHLCPAAPENSAR